MLELTLPAPGQRAQAPVLHGSSDALALAALALRARPLLVVTESAWHAQRLLEEIPFFASNLRVHLFPDWETLPYDHFSPHHDLVSERLATLYQMMRGEFDVAIVPVTTALCRLTPVEYLAAHTFFFKQGEKFAPEELRRQLTRAGYTHVTQVLAPGEYCYRGGLIDLFPMGSALPYRIDLLDNEIESIRSFDVDTQRSIYKVPEVRLLPAREFPMDEAGQTQFRRHFREKFEGDPSKSTIYRDVSKGIPSAGVEYYLPLFFDRTAVITDYLPDNTLVCLQGGLENAMAEFWTETRSRYEMLRGDRANPVLPPQDMFLAADAFFGALKTFARVELGQGDDSATAPLPGLAVERRATHPLHRLQDFLGRHEGRTLILAESQGRRETMLEYFAEYGLKPALCDDYAQFQASSEPVMLGVGPLHAGFVERAQRFAIITENELYAAQARTRRDRDTRRATSEGMLRDLSEVKIGDPVVHEQHGIGRYLGLQEMAFEEGKSEFLILEYQGGDKLYVPVAQLGVIGRYSGAQPEEAPLHKLGSGQWDKAKARAAKQVRDTAAELLALYAKRAARQGHAFGISQHDLEAFAAGFGFEETPDQAAAIEAVAADMASGKPMDRLVCGDVGFGKTEVALRAAFIAVADKKQVAVLCPTTLLAEQHFQTFSDRFADWPVRIAELSRFRSAKESQGILKGLSTGDIDIVIGTHKLLGKEAKFKRLGLVIIDEEHRFGVRQKEALKRLRAEVDVLTLTATPIPRTLAMSLEGIRDFSVIATAPEKRLAIKTFVAPFSEGLIREAVMRELKRGGQVYFLHNEVESIERMRERLTRLLPEARIAVAHGQMRERDLGRVMRDFTAQRFNVLLCSTIIETGIDIPTANTIVINRADKFGLAQLHQLRGRVGR
ncbi:MAG TPA: transcription-repair coupling factor, partial [Burkholderiales bacterium]|nr:transcription-repair coupling factor [Burkholderiales bacterium]